MNIRGIDIELHPPGEALSDHIRRENDFFEAHILDYLKDNFRTHSTIIDVGANIGNHSVYFANFLSYKFLLAIEPLPENYTLLKSNLTPYNSVGAVQNALGASRGTVRISPKWDNMGAAEINDNGQYEVACWPLDMLGLREVTLMKIDVEWYEPQVLQGAQDTIAICKPLILIEDANKAYANLLPDYELIKAWEGDKTYLYKWKE